VCHADALCDPGTAGCRGLLVKPCVVLCWSVMCCAAQGNVRGLLGSLQTVLWEDSGWKPINMGDLLEPAQVG
jgi:hypothetical protein